MGKTSPCHLLCYGWEAKRVVTNHFGVGLNQLDDPTVGGKDGGKQFLNIHCSSSCNFHSKSMSFPCNVCITEYSGSNSVRVLPVHSVCCATSVYFKRSLSTCLLVSRFSLSSHQQLCVSTGGIFLKTGVSFHISPKTALFRNVHFLRLTTESL